MEDQLFERAVRARQRARELETRPDHDDPEVQQQRREAEAEFLKAKRELAGEPPARGKQRGD